MADNKYLVYGSRMSFLIGLLIFNMIVLGANFCFLLIGGPPLRKSAEHAPLRVGNKTYSVEMFAVGVSVSALGGSWLIAWLYFLITGWSSFLAQASSLYLHVLAQLIASLTMILSGVAIFKKWRRFKGIFLISIAVLVASIGLAIVVYGPRGHGEPLFMYLFGAWTFIAGGLLTTAVYFFDRVINEWSEELPQGQTS